MKAMKINISRQLLKKQRLTEKYEELWTKIKDLIRSNIIISGNYDENYIKTKLNSDDNLTLKKTLEIRNMIVLVRSVFQKGKKYYPQDFLD